MPQHTLTVLWYCTRCGLDKKAPVDQAPICPNCDQELSTVLGSSQPKEN